MYSVIAQTPKITLKASSLLFDTRSTEKRSYQYNNFCYFIVTYTLTIYADVPHYI